MADENEVLENEGQTQGNQVETDEARFIDDDPMIAALKAAEAEIAAEEGKAPEQDAKPEAEEGKAEGNQPQAQPSGDKETIMIPKPRLDQALAERDRFKEQAAYFQGVAETQKQMLQGKAPEGDAGNGQEAEKNGPDDTAQNDLIAKAEAAKLAAAEQYESGEISLVEFKKIEIEKDREIRAEEAKRTEALADNARKVANETVTAHTTEQVIISEAVKIQAQHPYVAEIDKLPEADRDFVWQQIENEAAFNLSKKGVNAYDGSPASRMALIQEKAALTDKYGPTYTGKQLASQQQKQPNQLSEKAQDRLRKLELAQDQPPAFNPSGGDRADLTESDLENMSLDQMADALKSAPNLVMKAAGIRNR